MRIIDWSLSVRDIKNKPRHVLAFKFMSPLCFDVHWLHRASSLFYWLILSTHIILNSFSVIKIIFVSNFYSSFALKLSILSIILIIILIIRYNQIVFPNSFPINVSINLLIFISIIKSICSSIKNHFHFQIHFPFIFHCISHYRFPSFTNFSFQINDRDVNCCFIIYSSRVFAVCLSVLVFISFFLKIIFVIEIIFLKCLSFAHFYYLSVIYFSQYPYCFKLSNRF